MSTEEPVAASPMWRWVIGGLVVLVLAYPLTRLMSRSGQTAASPPPTWQAGLQRSLEAYQAGRYQDAVSAAKTAIASNPNLPEAYNNLAVSYLQLHMFDEATQAAEQAIRLRPDFQLAKNNLAWIQRERNASGPTATPQPTSQLNTLIDLSLKHAQAGSYKECIAAAQQAVKIDQTSARAFTNLGFCAWRLQRWDEAERATQEAIRLDSNLQVARNNLAAIQRERPKSGAPAAK